MALKLLTVLALLMSNGSTFQSFGAAQVKEPSPSVAFDLKQGQLSKNLSLEFLRLYLDGSL